MTTTDDLMPCSRHGDCLGDRAHCTGPFGFDVSVAVEWLTNSDLRRIVPPSGWCAACFYDHDGCQGEDATVLVEGVPLCDVHGPEGVSLAAALAEVGEARLSFVGRWLDPHETPEPSLVVPAGAPWPGVR